MLTLMQRECTIASTSSTSSSSAKLFNITELRRICDIVFESHSILPKATDFDAAVQVMRDSGYLLLRGPGTFALAV